MPYQFRPTNKNTLVSLEIAFLPQPMRQLIVGRVLANIRNTWPGEYPCMNGKFNQDGTKVHWLFRDPFHVPTDVPRSVCPQTLIF